MMTLEGNTAISAARQVRSSVPDRYRYGCSKERERERELHGAESFCFDYVLFWPRIWSVRSVRSRKLFFAIHPGGW